MNTRTILYVINDAAFFISHRLPLAREAARTLNARIALASAPADTDIAKELQNNGIAHYPLPMKRISVNPLVLTMAFWRLLKIVSSVRPALIHAIAMKAIVLCAGASVFRRAPAYVYLVTGLGFVFTRDTFFYRVSQTLLLRILRLAFLFSNAKKRAVIAQNVDDRDILKTTGEKYIALIEGSGVDVHRIAATPLPDDTRPIVLTATRLLHSKGLGDVAATSAILSAKGMKARFIVAGDLRPDSPDALTQKTIDEWQNQTLIEWIGFSKNISEWITRASVICYPSWYREGVPLFLLEAAAHGRPIVTTDRPGCRDAVIDGKTGFVVPAKNPEALAEALTLILSDPMRAQAMGSAARQLVQDRFSLERVNNQTTNVYRDLLKI